MSIDALSPASARKKLRITFKHRTESDCNMAAGFSIRQFAEDGAVVSNIGKKLKSMGMTLSERLELPKAMVTIKGYTHEHPVLSLLLGVVALMCLLPILTFVCFVVATLGFTFMGFLFVEGTLLTVGTFLLSGVLFVVGLFALGFSAFVAAVWIVINKGLNVLSIATTRLSLKPREPKGSQINGLHHID